MDNAQCVAPAGNKCVSLFAQRGERELCGRQPVCRQAGIGQSALFAKAQAGSPNAGLLPLSCLSADRLGKQKGTGATNREIFGG